MVSEPVPGSEPGDLEAQLLGARCELDRDEVSSAAGVPELEARAMWNALGFPVVAAGEKAFTRLDVQALSTVVELRESGLVDDDTLLVLARSMGQGWPGWPRRRSTSSASCPAG